MVRSELNPVSPFQVKAEGCWIYQSSSPPPSGSSLPPREQAPDRSGHHRTATRARSQWPIYRTSTASALNSTRQIAVGLNHNCQSALGTTGPQPQLPDRSGHYPTSTAHSLPDLNSKCQIAVATTGPQQQAPDRSGHYTGPRQQALRRSGQCRTSTASA